jgi:hypothetical protein
LKKGNKIKEGDCDQTDDDDTGSQVVYGLIGIQSLEDF